MSMILNPYRYAASGSDSPFGLASRDFDGINDYIGTSYAGVLGGNARTICGWFKTTDTRTGGNVNMILSYGRFSTARGVFIQITNGVFVTDFYITGISGGSGLNDGAWHHFALVVPAGVNVTGVIVYIDGSSIALSTWGTALISTQAVYPINIGRRFDAIAYFNGNLADIRMYSRAITSSEAADLAAGNDIDDTGLEGWWLLNDDDVLDYSGNSRDGTNYGSTYSTDGPLD